MNPNTSETSHSSSKENLEKRKKLEKLIAKQGVLQTATFEHLFGTGASLWNDEREFKIFLDAVKFVRHEKG